MKTLVVYAHPHPASYTAALRDRVVAARRAAGDDVRITDLYAIGFQPELSAEEEARHLEVGGHADVAQHVDDLTWCDQLVLVYPTWWSGQPAMLKGWMDRVWVRGAAWELPAGSNRVRSRLHNVRRLVVVTTHGSSKWVNVVQGQSGRRVVTRTLRAVCHPLARTRWIAFYGMDQATDDQRRRFLDSLPARLKSRWRGRVRLGRSG